MTERFPIRKLIDAISGNVPPGTDWERLLAAANQTLTTAILAERLLSKEDALPDDVRQMLSLIYQRSAERNARMRGQLAEAAAQLNKVGIRPLLLKGVAIQSTEEAATDGRILSDLDLMVQSASLPDALSALEEIGYRCEQRASDSRLPVVLQRTSDVGPIDLHHQFYCDYPVLGFEQLGADANSVRVGGGEALLPTPTKQLATLVAHDQLQDRDYWRGTIDLRHLIDCAALVRAEQGIDWHGLDDIFPGGYPKRALRTHLLTLNRLLDAQVPEAMRSGWRPRMQYWRRMMQVRRPAILIPATFLSVVSDPPWQSIMRVYRRLMRAFREGQYTAPFVYGAALVTRTLRRYMSSSGPGKT